MPQQNESSDEAVPQKDLYGKALLSIKKDVTRDDRINCAKKVKRSKRSIDRYVNGHVYDIAIAVKILHYLKREIAKRTEALK